jgi:hypothetical protein
MRLVTTEPLPYVPGDARVLGVADPGLDPQLIATAHEAAALPGVVHVTVAADTDTQMALAEDVLAGLGKDLALWRRRAQDELMRLTTVWIAARPTTDLIVTVPSSIKYRLWREICELAQAGRCRLWLISEGFPERRRYEGDTLAQHGKHDIAPEAFLDHWRERLDAAEPLLKMATRSRRAAFPSVPDDDFTTFRTAIADLLEPDDRRRVEALWRDSYDQAVAWATASEVTEEAAAGHIRSQTARCRSSHEALVVVRAVQSAMLVNGWLVKVVPERFTAERADRDGDYFSVLAHHLHRLQSPTQAAVAALVACTEQSMEPLISITLVDVAGDGSSVDIAGEPTDIPEELRVFIRATLLARMTQGAAPGDQFLAGTDGNPVKARGHNNRLHRLSALTGLRLLPARAMTETNHRWAYRQGISVKKISTAVRRTRPHD